MKCSKCGYLGFETSDRCRNCGYEFSLALDNHDPFDRTLDSGPDESESKPPFDLDRIIGAEDVSPVDDLPLFVPATWRPTIFRSHRDVRHSRPRMRRS